MSIEARMKSLLEEASVLERAKAALKPLGEVLEDSDSAAQVSLRPHKIRRMDDFRQSGFGLSASGSYSAGERWESEYVRPMRQKVAEALKKAKIAFGDIAVDEKGYVTVSLTKKA